MKNEKYFNDMADFVKHNSELPEDVEKRMMSAFRQIERVVRHRCAEKSHELAASIMNLGDYS